MTGSSSSKMALLRRNISRNNTSMSCQAGGKGFTWTTSPDTNKALTPANKLFTSALPCTGRRGSASCSRRGPCYSQLLPPSSSVLPHTQLMCAMAEATPSWLAQLVGGRQGGSASCSRQGRAALSCCPPHTLSSPHTAQFRNDRSSAHQPHPG
jgi:hypothetical protein